MTELRLEYGGEFRCIGPKCEDQCCSGWNVVPIDKLSYTKYEGLPALRPVLEQHVRVLDTPNDFIYAQITFPQSSQTCPFLTTDGWCGIHQDYGADHLAPICAEYPRIHVGLNGSARVVLLLSCPEAVRLTLLRPDFVPIKTTSPGNRPDYRHYLAVDGTPARSGKAVDYESHVRTFSLLLLHDRAYPVWQRLFLLGMFCKRLTEVLDPAHPDSIQKLLADFASFVQLKSLCPSLEGIPVQSAVQLRAVIEFAHRLQTMRASFTRMQECIHDFMHGIEYAPDAPIEDLALRYSEAYERYYRPFFDSHSYVLENYLSNYIFLTGFPNSPISQSQPKTPLTSFYLMCLQYAVIKGLLIGIAGHHRQDFAAEHVVKLVQSFSKLVEHAPEFLHGLKQDLISPAGIAVLLKN